MHSGLESSHFMLLRPRENERKYSSFSVREDDQRSISSIKGQILKDRFSGLVLFSDGPIVDRGDAFATASAH